MTKEELAKEYAKRPDLNGDECFDSQSEIDFLEGYSAAESEIRELREKLEVAVKCVEFYADRGSWKFNSYSSDCKEVIAFSDLGCKSYNGENDFKDYACSSGGRRAREAMEKLRSGK